MRDAKADVTDMRAPSKTQNVRRKNMAFDIDAERERTIEELGGLEKDVDMVPVPRPWEEPGAKRRRWWKGVQALVGRRIARPRAEMLSPSSHHRQTTALCAHPSTLVAQQPL